MVTHSKVSGKSDGDDTGLVRPSDWDAEHVVVPVWDEACVLRTGAYYGSRQGTSGTVAISASKLYALPIIVARDITVDRIAIEVTGAVAANARLGIYNNGTNLVPGTRLLDAGEVSVATTGIKAATISQSLTKGIYWLVVVSNGTPTLRKVDAQTWTVIGDTAADFTKSAIAYRSNFTYAALPASFPTAGEAWLNYGPILRVRILSLD